MRFSGNEFQCVYILQIIYLSKRFDWWCFMYKCIIFDLKESQNQSLSNKKTLNPKLRESFKVFLYTCYRDVAAVNKTEHKLPVPTYRNWWLKLLLFLWLGGQVINFCNMTLCPFLSKPTWQDCFVREKNLKGLHLLNESYLPAALIWSYL